MTDRAYVVRAPAEASRPFSRHRTNDHVTKLRLGRVYCRMNIYVFIAASSLLLAGCGPRIVALDISGSWFECGRDRECTILEDPRCQLIPINRRYADSFAAWVRRYRAEQVRDEPCVRNDSEYLASCDSGRCTSNLIRTARDAHRRRRGSHDRAYAVDPGP